MSSHNLYLGREQAGTSVPGQLNPINEVAMEQNAVRLLADLHVRLPSVRREIVMLSGGPTARTFDQLLSQTRDA